MISEPVVIYWNVQYFEHVQLQLEMLCKQTNIFEPLVTEQKFGLLLYMGLTLQIVFTNTLIKAESQALVITKMLN